MSKLDAEEEVLEVFETGKLKKSKNSKQQIKQHMKVPEATFKKDTRINIRLSSRDFGHCKQRP